MIAKNFIVFIAVLLISATIIAQDQKHEIELGVGIWNTNEIINTFSEILVSAIPNIEMDDSNSYGSIHLGYKYRITDRVGVGGLFAYDHSTAKGVVNDTQIGKFNNNHFTLAAEADYIYSHSGNLRLYGLAGLGATLYTQKYTHYDTDKSDSDSNIYLAFQITPIGLRYGNKFGGFAELGFGYRGILNVGAFYRF